MPGTFEPDDEWNNDADEFDDYDSWDEGDSQQDLLMCPSCHQTIHEETQKCPHCGDWITPVSASSASKRFMFLAIIVLLVIALIALTIR